MALGYKTDSAFEHTTYAHMSRVTVNFFDEVSTGIAVLSWAARLTVGDVGILDTVGKRPFRARRRFVAAFGTVMPSRAFTIKGIGNRGATVAIITSKAVSFWVVKSLLLTEIPVGKERSSVHLEFRRTLLPTCISVKLFKKVK